MGTSRFIAATIGTLGLVALSENVIAGGFAIQEQGVKGLGNAFAGSAATAEGAETLFFNPAGMTRLHGSEIDLAGHLIIPSLDFEDRGSHLNGAVGGAPIPFTDDGADLALIPNLYYVHGYDDRLKFGAALNVPFAFLTDYEDGWQGRYHALRSEGFVINLNTSAAYRFNELLSMGIGFDAQYIDVTFSNALDFSTLCLGNPASAPGCGALGLTTPGRPATDGRVEFSGDDWSFGYNVGVLLEPSKATRIGVHYRSHIEHELSGEADFTVPVPAFAAATGAFQDTGASTTLDLPDSVSLSAHHQIDDRFAVLGDITWTHWSRFDQIIVRFDNPRQPPVVTPQDWEDVLRYALGITYHPEGPMTLRSGVAYDETPVPNAHLRSPRIPDRASYRYSEAVSLDFGYAHLFIDDAGIDNTEVNTGHVLRGDFDGEIDIIAAQLVWRMPRSHMHLCLDQVQSGTPRVPPAPSKLTRIGSAGHIGAGYDDRAFDREAVSSSRPILPVPIECPRFYQLLRCSVRSTSHLVAFHRRDRRSHSRGRGPGPRAPHALAPALPGVPGAGIEPS